MKNRLSICYYGSYNTGSEYSRTSTFIDELKTAGNTVTICHASYLQGSNEKMNALSDFSLKSVFRFLIVQFRLARQFVREHRSTDVLFVGTAGYLDMPLAYIMSKIFSKVFIFDAFYSMYDTIVLDRRLVKEKSFIAKTIRMYEKIIYRLPDAIIMDTIHNAEFVKSEFRVNSPLYHVPPGVPAEFQSKGTAVTRGSGEGVDQLICLFYGSYVPLQGAPTIVRAAKALENHDDILFVMIGAGQDHDKCVRIALQNDLKNIVFKPWMTLSDLSEEVRDADVCLGIFGSSSKAHRVIPYKVYSYMAAQKPIVTMRSLGIGEMLTDGVDAVLCNSNDAEDLATSILRLKNDKELRSLISKNAYIKYSAEASNTVIGERLQLIIEEVYGGG